MKQQQQILPAVAAIIFNEAGEVLLHRRNDVDQWCVFSGHVEFGESVEQAVLREIKEETEADAEIVRMIGVCSTPESQMYEHGDGKVHYITTYFQVKLLSAISPGFSNAETKELRYFDLNQLPDNLAKMSPFWLEDALDQRFSGSIR